MTDQRLCQKRGCPRTATVILGIIIPALGDPDGEPAALGTIGVELCQAHLEDADAQAFLHAGEGETRKLLEGLARPGVRCDFDNASLNGIPMASAAGQLFQELHTERKPN